MLHSHFFKSFIKIKTPIEKEEYSSDNAIIYEYYNINTTKFIYRNIITKKKKINIYRNNKNKIKV